MTGIADRLLRSWLDYQETFIPFLVLLFTSGTDFKLKTSLCFGSLCQLFPLPISDTYLARLYLLYRPCIYTYLQQTGYGRHIRYYLSIKMFPQLCFYACRPNMPPKMTNNRFRHRDFTQVLLRISQGEVLMTVNLMQVWLQQ